MSMISPEGYYQLFIENKSEKEIKKQVKDLEKEIKKLESYIKKDKVCLEKPDYKTRLLYNRQYLDYINKKIKEEQATLRRTIIVKDGITTEIEENLKKIDMSDKDQLIEILAIIKNKEAYKFVEPKKIDENSYYGGYYNYNDKLFELQNIIGSDYSYMKNFELIREKDIAELAKEELKTYVTRIFRGDRFCEGLIASCVDDGTLEKIIKRYIEIC